MKQLFTAMLFSIGLGACSHAPEAVETVTIRTPDEAPISAVANPAWRSQAISHYLRGDFPRAIQLFEAANLLTSAPEEIRSQYLLFYSYLATGDFTRAKETAEATAHAFPHQPLSYVQLGLADLWMGNDAKALESFKKAREFESHPPRVFFYAGLAAGRRQGTAARNAEFEKGKKEYDQILKSNPKDFTGNFELAGLLLYWNREIDRVPALLSRAKSTLPESTDEEIVSESRLYVSYYLPVLEGILLHRQGDAKESNDRLAAALANAPSGAKPEVAEILYYMGQNHLQLGNRSEGLGLLSRGMQLDPHGPFAGLADETIRGLASRKSTSP